MLLRGTRVWTSSSSVTSPIALIDIVAVFTNRTTSMTSPVTYDVAAGVATITLDRPAVLNALDTALAAALAESAERAADADGVFVAIVRGNGRAFCSGMDRTALAGGTI